MCTSGTSATGKRERILHLPSNNLGFTCAGVSLLSGYKRNAASQGSRRDQKIKRCREGRWSWTFKLAQKRSWVGMWSWAAKAGLLSLRVVPQQQCNGHRPYDCPSKAVETAIAQCTSHCTMARGHRLNTSIVLAAVHSLSSLFRVVSAVEPSPTPTPRPRP